MEVQDAQSALAPALPQQQSDIETAAMPSIETTSAEDIEVPATAKPTSPPKSGKGTPLPQSRKASPQTMTADSAVNAPAPAAPYGTRSRNRTGASRPNYAEDKEIEIEYEPQPAKKDVNPKKRKGGSNSRSTTVEPVAIPITLKSTTASTADGNGTAHSLRKEQIPAVTSKAVPTSSPQPNKKRKVNNQQALSITNGTQAAPKKDNTPIPLINQFENGSSILMFDNTGARLQDGKLIADDGTILGKNGESIEQQSSNVHIWALLLK